MDTRVVYSKGWLEDSRISSMPKSTLQQDNSTSVQLSDKYLVRATNNSEITTRGMLNHDHHFIQIEVLFAVPVNT